MNQQQWEKEFEPTNARAKSFISDLKILLEKHPDVSINEFKVKA